MHPRLTTGRQQTSDGGFQRTLVTQVSARSEKARVPQPLEESENAT
jgi:hypothetical protein